MEKIQAALAKARAARSGAAPAPEPAATVPAAAPAAPAAEATPTTRPDRPADTPATGAAADTGHAAAWAALPSWTTDPQRLEAHHIFTAANNAAAMEIAMMRTKLLQQLRANGWRRVAITSPGTGCGKSTVALNLGFSIARQPELRTLVGELDLRRPSLARILGTRLPHSFAAVLAGQARLADNAIRHGTNLAIATNHGPGHNPAELLNSSTVGPALDAIEAEFAPDVMIFDMPPMLVSDDTMAFVKHVDCALLVAAAGSTTVAEIDRCERELASQTNVMGVVLNKLRHMRPGQGYEYYQEAPAD